MLVAEKRQYDSILDEPVYKPRRKVKKSAKIKKETKVKYIVFTLLGCVVALLILSQYAKLNSISQDIVSLENQIKELNKINDSIEGELLASEDLKKIEKIAKEELGMMEPTAEQITPIAIYDVQETQKSDTTQVQNIQAPTGLLGVFTKILDFID